ncbi:tRNA (mnm(5)s(2)U34)-methyltransferase, chloroplastic isoform X2 [Cryptomeria japonica]|uniref:tRNA (mnm(5)s(2)U34)-methyltransferase, chloroplastic isoform X2 n=1 Tax=Cryptomeria japonica TaxID=3369 RepID=UPI0027D9E2C5|nr:tRNA (mnm(5)s(2)U34)-methyltransferase, chloroplastic isoform X2 [Cryptomeria japonica]
MCPTILHKCRSVALKARCDTRAIETGVVDDMTGFMFGKMKATDMAHTVWRHIVRGGDFVIDATCGNGHDTLALAKMVREESRKGLVYGMDLQQSALQNTSALLDSTLTPIEREQVKLFPLCHSKMEELVPEGVSVRLVAFNLGYLPGGNKEIITTSKTTLLGLDAAARVLSSGGLISIMSYVGHPGGREEYEAVRSYASNLPATMWVSSEHDILNRPSGPVLIFLFKR